ncbi:hypothetical protein SAMN05421877_11195 [Sphingobacterium lactis]|uniref:Uncharacterized protein n=1 Tax=Sphingobacterium lactis TaxID=797291 RepID=A0A1H6BRW5_9SPHI|nr:hypothetical protein SAMN05421877_11195 [Sphingobacterium lactis]
MIKIENFKNKTLFYLKIEEHYPLSSLKTGFFLQYRTKSKLDYRI